MAQKLEEAKRLYETANADQKYVLESLFPELKESEVKEVQEPTASDRGMAEEIIINLKRVEQDYHIDLTRCIEWLRSKVQKG